MFVPRQLGSFKLGITVPHNVLMSNQDLMSSIFIPGKKLLLMTLDVKGHHSSAHDSLTWRATGDRYTTLMFPDSDQCASVHTWCNEGLQWCTVPRISMSIVCNQYSMSRYQLVSVHSMAWPCLGLLAALLTSMFAESFYVLSSLCFASSLELTILGWHYFGSGTVSSINDRSFYPIPLLQKNNASWAQWR